MGNANYNKIGGGLIVLAIVLLYLLVSSVISNGIFVTMMFANKSTVLSILEPMGIQLYYTLLKPYLIYAFVRNTVLSIFLIVVLVYFFRKKRAFIKLMTALIIVLVLLIPVDYYAANFIFTKAHQAIMQGFIVLAVYAGIYILALVYLLLSKRVRATFVH